MRLTRPGLATLLGGVLLAACSVVGVRSGTEEPHYALLQRLGAIEIRRYEPRLAAETTVDASELAARSDGFRRLANYIFGGNADRQRIAMTAPVAQSGGGPEALASWTIRFFLPRDLSAGAAPRPNAPAVRIVELPAETVAVWRFSGSPTAEAVRAAQRQLLAALAPTRWRPLGAPAAWFYDPPWTIPFLRRNEAVVAVAPEPAAR